MCMYITSVTELHNLYMSHTRRYLRDFQLISRRVDIHCTAVKSALMWIWESGGSGGVDEVVEQMKWWSGGSGEVVDVVVEEVVE